MITLIRTVRVYKVILNDKEYTLEEDDVEKDTSVGVSITFQGQEVPQQEWNEVDAYFTKITKE